MYLALAGALVLLAAAPVEVLLFVAGLVVCALVVEAVLGWNRR